MGPWLLSERSRDIAVVQAEPADIAIDGPFKTRLTRNHPPFHAAFFPSRRPASTPLGFALRCAAVTPGFGLLPLGCIGG